VNTIVSVIIPIYKVDPDFFSKTIASVRSQSLGSFECIVIDESPESESQKRCKIICEVDPRIRYFHNTARMGLGASINFGLTKSIGNYIARLDGDDLCSPQRFERQVSFLEQNPHIDVVGSWMGIINSEGDLIATRIYPTYHERIVKRFRYSNALGHPSVMLRRSLIRSRVGPYRTDLTHCEDLELWLHLERLGHKFANIPERLLFYRRADFDRSNENWRLNVNIRMQYLVPPGLPSKLFFIWLLWIWSILPTGLRSVIYRKFCYLTLS
jgi:glycosyltransferase involved in cell wall biosynthesis